MHRGWLCLLLSVAALMVVGGAGLSSGHSAGTDSQWQPLPVIRVSSHVIFGPTPDGPGQFRQLAVRGVRTIVSVDGAPPDVESAKSAGIEYVHIPIGYDGVPDAAIAALTRVMHERSQPVYVHCHHGKHRGPAAAAVCAMIAGERNHEQALAFLARAGTSHDYAGLWTSVASFMPLPADALLPELVSSAEVEPMVDAMLRIDEHFDRLIEATAARQEDRFEPTAAGEGSVEAIRAARLLHEDFREAARLLVTDCPPAFVDELQRAEVQAGQIVTALRREPAVVPGLVTDLRQSCTTCHRRIRN